MPRRRSEESVIERTLAYQTAPGDVPSSLGRALEGASAADGDSRPATVEDIHEMARSLPGVTPGVGGLGGYQVSRRSFIYFRRARWDAVDPETGERYPDVIMVWVDSELEKEAILADTSLPFFTTRHFDGHPSILLRGSRVGELTRGELREFVERAWLARANPRAIAQWQRDHGGADA